jgi:hypothetical protein
MDYSTVYSPDSRPPASLSTSSGRALALSKVDYLAVLSPDTTLLI